MGDCCNVPFTNIDVFQSGTFGDASLEAADNGETPRVECKELSVDSKFLSTIVLQLPRFSKGYNTVFFQEFIDTYVGDDMESLGRLSFPNEWQLVLKSQELREKLLRIGKTRLHGRSCWIKPVSSFEIRGFIHWLPLEVPNSSLIPLLQEYGEVLYLESETKELGKSCQPDARRFSIFLKSDLTMDHLPHFLEVNKCRGLLTIKGREPMCFHCKDVGHRKANCNKHQKRLDEITKPLEINKSQKRCKSRGKRHDPKKDPIQMNINSVGVTDILDVTSCEPSNNEIGGKVIPDICNETVKDCGGKKTIDICDVTSQVLVKVMEKKSETIEGTAAPSTEGNVLSKRSKKKKKKKKNSHMDASEVAIPSNHGADEIPDEHVTAECQTVNAVNNTAIAEIEHLKDIAEKLQNMSISVNSQLDEVRQSISLIAKNAVKNDAEGIENVSNSKVDCSKPQVVVTPVTSEKKAVASSQSKQSKKKKKR